MIIGLILLGWLSPACAAEPRADVDADGFVPLFNGKDLSGWVPVNVAPSTFTVRDGMLICDGRPTGVMRTDRQYENFIVEVEWRHMVPKGNAGFFVWSDAVTARGVPFTRSIEVQVLDGLEGPGYTSDGDIFPIHGAKMTPDNGRGGDRAFPTEARANPSPQWNHYRIECRDGNIRLAVNGKVVTTGRNCSPRKGYICLESEGGIVHWRNLRIKELPPSTPAIEPRDVAEADRGFKSMYTGVDLSGWKTENGVSEHWKSSDWTLEYDGQGQTGHQTLWTDRKLGDYELILDYRTEGNEGITLLLRGADGPALHLGPNAPGARKTGDWNRVTARIHGSGWTASLNGEPQPVTQDETPGRGPGALGLRATQKTQFANIYIRPLR